MRRVSSFFHWIGRVALAACLLTAGLRAGAQDQPQEPLLGQPAPAIERADLDGKPLSLAGLRGKVVLVNFWATWCAPCQIELPRFVEWQRRYGAEGLQIVGISMDDAAAPARTLVKRRKLNYPVVMGDDKLGNDFGGVLGLPLSMVVDRTGRVAAIFRGEGDLGAMEEKVREILGQK